jgi:hypothetical protein
MLDSKAVGGFLKKSIQQKIQDFFYCCNRFILRRNFITTAMRKLPYLFQNTVLYFHAPNDSREISPETEKERKKLTIISGSQENNG